MHKIVIGLCVLLLAIAYTNASPANPASNEIQPIKQSDDRNAQVSDQNMIMLRTDQTNSQGRSLAEQNLIAPRSNPSGRSLINQIAPMPELFHKSELSKK